VKNRKGKTSTRSQIMATVKSSGNKSTEQRFVKLLRSSSIVGWRRHWPIAGKPDFVFPRKRIAVFIDGCFWHGCPKHCRMPASNVAYWDGKIRRNVRRDKKITRDLQGMGWIVFRFWEHELKGCASLSRKLNRLKKALFTCTSRRKASTESSCPSTE